MTAECDNLTYFCESNYSYLIGYNIIFAVNVNSDNNY